MNQPLNCCDGVVRYPDVSFACHLGQLPFGEITICVRGDVDSLTAPVLDEFLSRQLAVLPPFAGMEVVLTRTTFLGARGIAVLLKAAHEAGQKQVDFRIVGCSEWLLRVFGIAGVGGELAASATSPTELHARRSR